MTRNEDGQSTVEVALCLPIVVIVLAAVVQVGLVAIDHVRLWHAAREAARVAAVDSDAAEIRRAAEQGGLQPLEIEIAPEDLYRRQGEPVTVMVSYAPSTRVPVIGAMVDGFRLTAAASMRIEEP